MNEKPEASKLLTEEEEQRGWAKLPNRPKRKREAVEDFDELQVQLTDWGISMNEVGEADTPEKLRNLMQARKVPAEDIKEFVAESFPPSHCRNEATPADMEARLKESGLSKARRTAILARHFEHKNYQEIGDEIGKSKAWVAEALHCDLPATRLNPTAASAAPDAGRSWTLPKAMDKARQEVENFLRCHAGNLGWLTLGSNKLFPKPLAAENPIPAEEMGVSDDQRVAAAKQMAAERIVAFIRLWPRSLLNAQGGPRLIEALVGLLEAAHSGVCEHWVGGLLPKENRKSTSRAARDALKELTRTTKGNPFDYPPEFLALIVNRIQHALDGLQRAWRATGGETTARLEAMREKYGAELEGFTNKELPSLLEGDLLKASARVAEKATRISSETFEGACPEKQQAFLASLRS